VAAWHEDNWRRLRVTLSSIFNSDGVQCVIDLVARSSGVKKQHSLTRNVFFCAKAKPIEKMSCDGKIDTAPQSHLTSLGRFGF
jgi:hypothetical protein